MPIPRRLRRPRSIVVLEVDHDTDYEAAKQIRAEWVRACRGTNGVRVVVAAGIRVVPIPLGSRSEVRARI